MRVYRLVTRGTYEAAMFQRASMKLGLEQAVMSNGMFEYNCISINMDINEVYITRQSFHVHLTTYFEVSL